MAIREIAYSEKFKILVSVGFDFKVMVWNPYWKEPCMPPGAILFARQYKTHEHRVNRPWLVQAGT